MTPPQTPHPEVLLSLAQTGDGHALGWLLEQYRNYLSLLAHMQIGRRLQSKFDPSDLVQETCLAAHRDFAAFRGTTERELMAWLRQIMAMNLADLARRQFGAKRRDVRLERQLAGDLDESSISLGRRLAAEQSSPSQQAARREQAVLLADAIQALSADHREVIVLHHLEGLTFPEVAKRMNRSLDSVKQLWMRAVAKLRTQRLDGQGR